MSCSIKHIIFNKYATNLNTKISQRSLINSGLLLLLFEFNNFSCLIDIIDNIIYRPDHVTRTPTNGSAVLLSLVSVCITWSVYCTAIGGSSGHGRITHINRFWYNFDTVLCQFLYTGTSDRCLIGFFQILRFSSFSLYSLSFFLYSPFKDSELYPLTHNPWSQKFCVGNRWILSIDLHLMKTSGFLGPYPAK